MKYIFFNLLILIFIGCSSSETLESLDSVDETPVTVAEVNHTNSQVPVLVILVSFNNISITQTDSFWSQKIFGTNPGEVNDYFKQNSYGKNFQLQTPTETSNIVNDGVISTTLSSNHPNVSTSSSSFITLTQSAMIDALNIADNYIDFSIYDKNNDGYLQNYELTLVFIFAGFEDAYEGTHVTNGIWAHQYCFNSSNKYDNVEVSSCQKDGAYAVFGEQHNTISPYPATIGVIVHELGHALFKLPDLYNTYGSTGGIGAFGLMGKGAWGYRSGQNPGETPVHMSAWSKVYTKWITPNSNKGTTSLYDTSQNNYNIEKIDVDVNHYYLIENRSANGYDAGFEKLLQNGSSYSGGIALWYINNYKLTDEYFTYNNVNADTNDKGVDIVEAQNPIIDTTTTNGSIEALFYNPNKTSYQNLFDSVSIPSSVMSLNIR